MKYLFRKPSLATTFVVMCVSLVLLLGLPILVDVRDPGFESRYSQWKNPGFLTSDFEPFPFGIGVNDEVSEFYVVIEQEDELVILTKDDEDYELHSEEDGAFTMAYFAGEYKAGLWAPTRLLDGQVLAHVGQLYAGMSGGPKPPPMKRILEVQAKLVAAEGLDPRLASSQQIAESSIILSGYFINGLSVLAVFGVVWSLAWAPAKLRDFERQRLFNHDLCPMCSYDVRTTPGRCPECGWGQPSESN